VISEQHKTPAQQFLSGCTAGGVLVAVIMSSTVMLLRNLLGSHVSDFDFDGWVALITSAVCIAIATICIRISDRRGLEFPAGMALSILVTLIAGLMFAILQTVK
jgi:hypothetical protein